MQQYHFTLRFDDDEHSLTRFNGVHAGRVGELLVALTEAVHLRKNENFVLSEVRGNCYALELTSDSLTTHENLKVIHRKISENDYRGFTGEQKKYAATLKSILGDHLNLKAYDNDNGYEVRVREISLPKNPDHYFETGSAYGFLTGIGGSTLDGKSFIHLNEETFNIEITARQEEQLLPHFKKTRLRLSIRKKLNFETDKVISAILTDFETLDGPSFFEQTETFRRKHPNGFLADETAFTFTLEIE